MPIVTDYELQQNWWWGWADADFMVGSILIVLVATFVALTFLVLHMALVRRFDSIINFWINHPHVPLAVFPNVDFQNPDGIQQSALDELEDGDLSQGAKDAIALWNSYSVEVSEWKMEELPTFETYVRWDAYLRGGAIPADTPFSTFAVQQGNFIQNPNVQQSTGPPPAPSPRYATYYAPPLNTMMSPEDAVVAQLLK